MRILYIHGFNGTPEGHSFSLLNKHLPEGAQIFGMNYCQDDCALALEQIARTISEKKVHVLIGNKTDVQQSVRIASLMRSCLIPVLTACHRPSSGR